MTVWNVYNAPQGCDGARAACRELQGLLSLPDATFLAGDFNFPIAPWLDPAAAPGADAQDFSDWTAQVSVELVSPTSEPTHQAGNVLDLVWCTSAHAPRCVSSIALDLSNGSDRLPLCTEVFYSGASTAPRPVGVALPTLRHDAFFKALTDALNLAPPPPILATPADLDAEASSISNAISAAALQSAKPKRSCPRSLPFWTAECKEAAKDMREALAHLRRVPPGRDAAARQWFDTARCTLKTQYHAARRSYYNKRIEEEIRSVGDVTAFTQWRKRPFSAASPPLTTPEGTTADATVDKQLLLFRSFSAATPGQVDDLTPPQAYPGTLPFSMPSAGEVEDACLKVKSSTPGQDGIPVTLLKLAWMQICERVHRLFVAALDIGYHPRCFRLTMSLRTA